MIVELKQPVEGEEEDKEEDKEEDNRMGCSESERPKL